MKRRMLDGGIWANDKFARLPYPARLLQMGLINLADDQGRLIAHPSYLRSQIFPYDEEVSASDVRTWLAAIVKNGTAILYEANDREYVQLVNWWEYQNLQYAAPSEHPQPEGWQDRIRYNAKGGATLTCNWITPKGETPADTCDQCGNPLPFVAENPPRNPGGRPPRNPGGNTNNDQIKSKSNTRASAQAASTKTPPANTRTRADVTAEKSMQYMNREYADINPKLLTQLTNHVKRIYGYSALIDKPGSDSIEDKMRDEAYRLWVLGYNSDDDMIDLQNAWNNYAAHFTNKRPCKDQLYELAITLVSSVSTTSANAAALDFALEELV